MKTFNEFFSEDFNSNDAIQFNLPVKTGKKVRRSSHIL